MAFPTFVAASNPTVVGPGGTIPSPTPTTGDRVYVLVWTPAGAGTVVTAAGYTTDFSGADSNGNPVWLFSKIYTGSMGTLGVSSGVNVAVISLAVRNAGNAYGTSVDYDGSSFVSNVLQPSGTAPAVDFLYVVTGPSSVVLTSIPATTPVHTGFTSPGSGGSPVGAYQQLPAGNTSGGSDNFTHNSGGLASYFYFAAPYELAPTSGNPIVMVI